MRAEKVITHLLGASSAVSAIVEDRIFGVAAADEISPPLIVYRKASVNREDSLERDELCEVSAQMEVSIVTKSYSQLKDLGELVRLALAYHTNETIGGVEVLDTLITDEGSDEYDDQRREFFQVWTYEVKHLEP